MQTWMLGFCQGSRQHHEAIAGAFLSRRVWTLARLDKNVPPITLRDLSHGLGAMALALGVLVLLLFPPKGASAAGTPELSVKDGVSKTTQRIPTQGGGIKGELVVHVLKAGPSPNAPVIVLCPGSWEYSKAWEVYFPPFTPDVCKGGLSSLPGILAARSCLALVHKSHKNFSSQTATA